MRDRDNRRGSRDPSREGGRGGVCDVGGEVKGEGVGRAERVGVGKGKVDGIFTKAIFGGVFEGGGVHGGDVEMVLFIVFVFFFVF